MIHTRIRLASVFIAAALSSCGVTPPSICDVAREPEQFIGRSVSVQDVIVVDGHGEPFLIPNSDCAAFAYFQIDDRKLDEATRGKFGDLVRALNTSTVGGERAGLAGTYRLQLASKIEPFIWSVSLIDARDLRVVSAASKSKSLENQMQPESQDR